MPSERKRVQLFVKFGLNNRLDIAPGSPTHFHCFACKNGRTERSNEKREIVAIWENKEYRKIYAILDDPETF
jgi:hypothetical protein